VVYDQIYGNPPNNGILTYHFAFFFKLVSYLGQLYRLQVLTGLFKFQQLGHKEVALSFNLGSKQAPH